MTAVSSLRALLFLMWYLRTQRNSKLLQRKYQYPSFPENVHTSPKIIIHAKHAITNAYSVGGRASVCAGPGDSVQKGAKWATKMNTLHENSSELLFYATFTVFNKKTEIKK
jgi:hypothetical protein